MEFAIKKQMMVQAISDQPCTFIKLLMGGAQVLAMRLALHTLHASRKQASLSETRLLNGATVV